MTRPQEGKKPVEIPFEDAVKRPGKILLERDTGYRGLWYWCHKVDSPYKYKYSGGLGTYCAKHIPQAVYAPEANKTFFVYGGMKPDVYSLLEMVSYYDHATGTVPRPMILMDKQTADGHDNPVLALDGSGHLLVFASAHGTGRPAYIFRSRKPYSIDAWDLVCERNFSYPQPWWFEGQGIVMLETLYHGGRFLHCRQSADGRTWGEPKPLARMHKGHYQISRPCGTMLGTAFNYHPSAWQGDPEKSGLDYRTNLYYMETRDCGDTWQNAAGELIETPLEDPANGALVYPYEDHGLNVYMKDINYDTEGRPAILHLVSRSWFPGPEAGPREWRIAHWNGERWAAKFVAASDSNYDTGSLYIEPGGTWRVIGPTQTGPQPYNPGGEIAMWVSNDEGYTWTKERDVTKGSRFNHTYVRRPVNAHADFYAFWADGHGFEPSQSHLYFCNQEGTAVCRLPGSMDGEEAAPERMG